tara:strand:- start:2218 stop:2487 length:270 start_codon:yes stop_codon:yes gene_type:complete
LFYVYLIISKKKQKFKTYVGYTNNLKQRVFKHNTNKGAKSTKGRQWKLIYKKKFSQKKLALKYEYFFKKNRILRNIIKNKYVNKTRSNS